jgi:hypothetical protein
LPQSKISQLAHETWLLPGAVLSRDHDYIFLESGGGGEFHQSQISSLA